MENKKQHVVPKFYLKGFSKDGKRFFQFSATTRKCVGVNIKDVCSRNYFYDISSDVNHLLEKTISKIETSQGLFLQSFLTRVRENNCSLDDYATRFNLMYFILFMNARGFNARKNTTKAITDTLNLSIKTMFSDDSFRKRIEKDTGSQISVSSDKIVANLTKDGEIMWQLPLFEKLEPIADWLCRSDFFHVFCIRNDKTVNWKSNFYTSDNPVYYVSLVDNGPYGKHGLLLPGTVYFMPLAYDVFVVVGDESFRDSVGFSGKYGITYLYTSDESTNTIVKYYNQIIIQASSDLLFSIDSNVVLPKTLLKLHEKGQI